MFTHTTLRKLKKINQLYEAKALDDIPMCPREHLVILSNTTGFSFAKERIGPLAAFIIIVFYLLVLYLSALSKNPKNLFAKYLQRIPDPSHSSTPSAPRWVEHSYLSKILRYTPYTCGSSKPHTDPPVSLDVCSFHEPHLESLHVCSFHEPHMDPPVSLHVCSFQEPQLESLHVCSSHKPHKDILVSLHVCSSHKPHMDPPVSLHVC